MDNNLKNDLIALRRECINSLNEWIKNIEELEKTNKDNPKDIECLAELKTGFELQLKNLSEKFL